MSLIQSGNGHVVGEGGCGDEEIIGADHFATHLEVRPEPGMDSRDLERERENRNGSQYGLHEPLTAAAAYGTLGTVDSVKKF